MSAHIPNAVPAKIRAGDTVAWRTFAPLFPAGLGWQLQTTLINATGKITVSSAADGDAHLVNVAASTSAGWAPGRYTWATRAVLAGESYTIATGEIEVLPDLAVHVALDTRSHAEKTLAALEAWIEGHDLSVAEYEIAGRRMKYIPIAELMKLRDQYRREVRQQSGKPGRVLVRF